MSKFFARKLIRPFGTVTNEDVENEIRAIEKLCTNNGHVNIIKVLRHGWLDTSPYYFIDMELCQMNLEQYISGRFGPAMASTQTSIDGRDMERNADGSKFSILWDILNQITEGLHFIHNLNEVHRDLKPRNGNNT